MLKRFFRHCLEQTGMRRRIDWYLTKINYIRKVRINGSEIRIPVIKGTACDMSEPWMSELLAELFGKTDGAFVDVGVNVGQTLVKVKTLDPDREYIGFEPNPACVSYTQILVRENRFRNCALVPVGLYTDSCVLKLDMYTDEPTDACATVIENLRPEHDVYTQIFVPVFRADALSELLQAEVGVIKIDVEGAELEVIKSLLDLIRRQCPILVMELLPVYSPGNHERLARQEELERMLAGLGYELYRVGKTPLSGYAGLKRIQEVGIHSDLTQCDYVAMPRSE